MATGPHSSTPVATTGDSTPASSRAGPFLVLAAAFLGWLFAGVQLGLMPLASLSVSKDLLGPAFSDALAGDWFARYTAALMAGAAFGGIIFGDLGDRIGRTKGLSLSIGCYSLFGGLAYFVTNQEQLLVLRFLAGLGIGGVWPNGVALIAEFWPDVSRPTLAGIFGTSANMGVFVMSQLGKMKAVTAEDWRWLMIAGSIPLVLSVLTWLLLPESPKWLATRSKDGLGIKAAVPLRELFRPEYLRLTIVGICLAAIPLIGAWAASKWMIPWADKVGTAAGQPGYKATTQQFWAFGAILGSLLGGHAANLFGRRVTYFCISLVTVVVTGSIFVFMKPMDPFFLPATFLQGFVATLFFGWLPLYLPELFPTAVRATGTGVTYNFGRFATAAGVLLAGGLMHVFHGDYARVGAITSLIYAFGMVVILFAPDTTRMKLRE